MSTRWSVWALAFGLTSSDIAAEQEGGRPLSPGTSVVAAVQGQRATSDTLAATLSKYLLGPGDQLNVWALGVAEFGEKPHVIDNTGFVDLPFVGRIKASGSTTEELKASVANALKQYVRSPQVSITVAEYGSQPISIVGAVNKSGVHQLKGGKSLIELISMAEGLRPDAGYRLKVVRQMEWGEIPLKSTAVDKGGSHSTAEISIAELFDGAHPELNITMRPHDVVSVARAQTIYVLGQVVKSGGFLLGERQSVSVLQALAMAEGLSRNADPKKSKVLRSAETGSGAERKEIPLDIASILSGKSADFVLQQNDILFVPNNKAKGAAMKALETAVNVGSGITIWRVGLPR